MKKLTVLCVFGFAVLIFANNESIAAPKIKTNIQNCMVITVPGAYTVTRNLPADGGLLVGGNCILVEADFVVLDLSDQSITGSGIGTAITDGGVPRTNIRIRHGTVSGFSTGIDLAASSDSMVEYVKAFDNSSDGIAIGKRSVARYNIAIENDRGLVVECPANTVGNSAWDNVSNDLFQVSPSLCTVSEGHNSFGSSGGGGGSCELLGFTDCSGICTDTQTSEASCGSCGSNCAAGELCSSGICTLSCQVGLTNCVGICTDTQTNESNCSACGVTCGAGLFCVNGVCTL